MRRWLAALLFLFVALAAQAQTLQIIDKDTHEPVELVSIMSLSPRAFVTTNAKGQANIGEFKGAPAIEIRMLGYKTQTHSYKALGEMGYLVELSPSFVNADEVVVAATRWNETTNELPSKVASITPRDATVQQPQTAADLLAASGKVYVQKSQQGGGSPMIRGFATNRLLYTIDGVRMNTAIFRGGNIHNVISLDPFSIEKTEVLFGPGSVVYGSDAIGGVMSFQSLTPRLALDSNQLVNGVAATRYSTANNENSAHFHINVGWKRWAFVSSISANRYDHLRMGSNGPDEYLRPFHIQRQDSMDVVIANTDARVQRPTGYSQVNLMQKLRFRPNEAWDFQYGFHYSETSDIERYDRHIRKRNGLPRYGEWRYGPQKWMMNNLNITHTGYNAFYDKVSLRLAQQSFEESRISRDFNDVLRETRVEQVEAYSANLDFIREGNGRNKLYYGVEAVLNEVNSTGTNTNIATGISQAGASRYPQATWASYGVYLTDQYRVSKKLLAKAGARYSQFVIDARFDTSFYNFSFTSASLNKGALTSSMGLVWTPSKHWVFATNASTAFRAPNVDDMGKVFDSEPGAVVVPNPNLEAEYAYNIDARIARKFGEYARVDVAGYYTVLDNALVRRNFQLNGADSILYDGELSQVQAIQNAASAYVYGFQVGFELELPKGFGLATDFNYQQGEEELDDGTTSALRHAAPWFGQTSLSYKVQKLTMMCYAVYNGEISYENLAVSERGKDYLYATDANGNPYSPAWYTLNFKAMYQFAENFVVTAGLENVTDQRYRPYSSGIAGAGRNFLLALRCNF